jgi:ABC-type Zn uptake system ZnuABC Zn-binding protein ZnuA
MELKDVTIQWVTKRDETWIVEELSMKQLLNTIDYIEDVDLKYLFTDRVSANKLLKTLKEE